ncbi:MAG: Eco57I restriction-modification methylase domain-containing protein [Candidatus Thorarchaeota archaeon]
MKGFNDYLEKEKLLQKLIEYYKVDREELELNFKALIEENAIPGRKFKALDSDHEFLGVNYEDILNYDDRKSLGQFYTPKSVVDYILNAVGYRYVQKIEDKKFIDISCGVGNFIIPAIKILISRYLHILKRKEIQELLPTEAKTIIKGIYRTIYGIDVNPIACILCQINIHYAIFEIFNLIKEDCKNYHVPIFNIKAIDAMIIDKSAQYDIVVGNPPYLFIRDIPIAKREIIKKMNFETNKGQYDYFQIFIELGIKILRNNGALGYIVPDSLLALSNSSRLRRYIYNSTKIKEIYHSGPQFDDPVVSNIIIILEKEIDRNEREKNRVKVKILNRHQKEFIQRSLKNWDYQFLIHLSDDDMLPILSLTEKFPKLKELMLKEDFKILLSRGVELTKSGEVIFCRQCKKYFPIPKKEFLCPNCKVPFKKENIESIIKDNPPEMNRDHFELFVDSIQRYRINSYKYIELDKKGINYKNLEIYEDRIIIRQMSQNNLICATYEKNLSLTSQSFYNLKICHSPVSEFNNIYLLGLINSLLFSYYFIKSFGSYKKLFPRILIEKIKDLPIKVPRNKMEKDYALKLIDKVRSLLISDLNNINKFKQIQREIDDLVFLLYGIKDAQKQHILKIMDF